jgi:hypothetical protein
MIPETNVPWKESSRFSVSLFAPGPAKPRATMTFGLVPPGPFGNPGGNENPAGLRNGCVSSTPSSTTATLTPSPEAPVRPAN